MLCHTRHTDLQKECNNTQTAVAKLFLRKYETILTSAQCKGVFMSEFVSALMALFSASIFLAHAVDAYRAR
jgi:hypothetical protein